jgi:hypothetical protein
MSIKKTPTKNVPTANGGTIYTIHLFPESLAQIIKIASKTSATDEKIINSAFFMMKTLCFLF